MRNEQEQMEPISTDFPQSEPTLNPEIGLNQPAPVPTPAPSLQSSGIGLWVRDLLVSAAASVLIIPFLYQPVRVEGTSMLPRLEDQDRLFINKFVYHVSAIERGD